MARLSVLPGASDAPPKNAKEALHQQSEEFLDCRDLRHPWRRIGVFYAQGSHGKEVHRKLVCERCGTEAVDKWSPRGIRYARQYNYPKGYTIPGVKIKPVDVRQEILKRVDVYANEEDMMASLFNRRGRKRA